MIVAVLLTSILSVIALNLYNVVQGESTRGVDAVQRQAAYAAAEAGIDEYIAKLTDDPLYYSHYVGVGEATRQWTNGSLVSPTSTSATVWPSTYDLNWSYPNGFGNFKSLENGYEYSLKVFPPTSTSSTSIKIQALGRKLNATIDTREIEVVLQPSSVTDFQMISVADISYGSGATTTGLIYAGTDSNGVAHNVTHNGTATANIYAEGHVYGSPTLTNGAQKYDSTTTPSVRSVVTTPVDFNSFLTSLSDISRASQTGGVYLNDTSKAAWKLIFSNGTFTAASCTQTSGADVAAVAPTCGTATTYSVPSNGAIYSPQTIVIAGTGSPVTSTIGGRVTVASNNNIVIGTNIVYASSGTNVLGLNTANNTYIAQWAPYDTSWRAATISQTGAWRSYVCPGEGSGDHGTMTFNGSTVTSDGGCMTMFRTRIYNYDSQFLWLRPPWFPSFQNPFTMTLFRELQAP
jgi:hypothetical protein